MFGRVITCSIAKDNGRAPEFIKRKEYKDKSHCYECGVSSPYLFMYWSLTAIIVEPTNNALVMPLDKHGIISDLVNGSSLREQSKCLLEQMSRVIWSVAGIPSFSSKRFPKNIMHYSKTQPPLILNPQPQELSMIIIARCPHMLNAYVDMRLICQWGPFLVLANLWPQGHQYWCFFIQEAGHLSYKCPKNSLGEREPPAKKKKVKSKPAADDSDSDFDGDIVIVKKQPASGVSWRLTICWTVYSLCRFVIICVDA